MKKYFVSIALVFAFLAPLAVSAQKDGAEELAIINLIREREKFPLRRIASLPGVLLTYGKETDFEKIGGYERERAWVRDGVLKVVHSGRYNHGEELEKTMGIEQVKGGAFDITEQYFVALPPAGMSRYFVPEGEWNAPNTSFANPIGPDRIGKAYSERSSVPESVRSMPEYLGVVDMGTVDFDRIIRVERKDMVQEMIDKVPAEYHAEMRNRLAQGYPNGLEEIKVYWKGRFVRTTPFSGSEYRYDDNHYFVTRWQTDGSEITKYLTLSEEGQS